MRFKELVTRHVSLLDVKAWHEGESKELKKWFGFGFFNHIFVSENGRVTVYYDTEELDKFDEIIREKLTEDLFNELCDYLFELIEKSKNAASDEEIFELYSKMWPAFTIFDELSKHPELGNEYMIRRLIRIRKTTEDFSFLENKLNHPEIKTYLFHKEEIFLIPFEQFIKEKGIEIVE